MKALSIRQPWAWLIVYGFKNVENRTWRTSYRGPLLIHAGTRVDPVGYDVAFQLGVVVPDDLDLGGIIGQVDIVDCVESMDSPWFSGPFGFVIANPRPLPFRACRGMLGLFSAPSLSGFSISSVETSKPASDKSTPPASARGR